MVAVAAKESAREFVFAGFVLTPSLMRLDLNGEPIALPHSAFHALVVLIENRDRIVTKKELLDTIWSGTAVEENNLNQSISALRKIFADTRKDARFIATIPGAGYRFVMEVLERDRTPNSPVTVSDSAPASLGKHRLSLTLALVVSVLLCAAAWKVFSRPDASILVLPLEAFGPPGEDSAYIRKGLATEIEAELARSPGLHVAAGVPASILNGGDVREIARKVHANAVLRGQIHESQRALSFTFELVNPETERILWSDQFEVKRSELSAAESRVTAGVFKAMVPGRSGPWPRKVNPAAHELYLQGRFTASTRGPEDLDRAVALFERAIALDPNYADAYMGIADAAGLRVVNGPAPAALRDKARSAALRAVELDPESAPAHAALGLVYYADWKWTDSRRELQLALKLNPYYSITHHRLAMIHYVFNDYREAEAELKRAQELNPYVAAHAYTLAEVYIGARRFDDAIQTSQAILRTFPGSYPHFLEMQAYLGLGNRAAALDEIRIVNQLDGLPSSKALVAISEGRNEDARRLLTDNGRDDTLWAEVCARIGDRDRMLAILRHLIDNRDVIVLEMKDDAIYDPYRKDPSFQQLIAQLQLP